MARRAELVDELAAYRMADEELSEHPWGRWAEAQAHETSRMPGNVSRWNAGKNLTFVPLRPELVVEVAYDQMEATGFGTRPSSAAGARIGNRTAAATTSWSRW